MKHLEASLRSLIAQSQQVRNPEWIRRQPAGSLAVLFGILFDRPLRTFELLPAFLRSLRDGEG